MRENLTLYYCYDPMCSYCYAFEGSWAELRKSLAPEITVRYIVGGLAKDNDLPMPMEMQLKLQEIWRHIQDQFDKPFNFDFWSLQQPRRATYDACRATLIAREYGLEQEMIECIQKAYYLDAKNPSNVNTLADCAESLSLERKEFVRQMASDSLNQRLLEEIRYARQLGLNSFPSLLLEKDGQYCPIGIDYIDASTMQAQITKALIS